MNIRCIVCEEIAETCADKDEYFCVDGFIGKFKSQALVKLKMERRQEDDEDSRSDRGSQPDPLTTPPRMSKMESDWVMVRLRERRAREAILHREAALQAHESSLKSSGGQLRSADHPRRANKDFQTMSADQLEDRDARWGCISFEQIAVSREARGWPTMMMYSRPSPATSQHRDWFVSYEQGADQILQHYLMIKWDLFKQGWPDPLRRSTAFGIEDTISGLYHPIVRNELNRARPPSMSALEIRAARQTSWKTGAPAGGASPSSR